MQFLMLNCYWYLFTLCCLLKLIFCRQTRHADIRYMEENEVFLILGNHYVEAFVRFFIACSAGDMRPLAVMGDQQRWS